MVEQRHRRLKNALGQALILRGSRDFDSEEEYRTFVRRVVDRRNRLVSSKLNSERRHLHPLPPAPVPEYVNYRVRVRRWSTIRVANRTYSVPSRLIGGTGEMSAKYQMAAKHLERQAQEQKAAQRQKRASRRRSGSAARDKEPGYSLPQIVITTEPGGGGRMGGL